MSYPRFLRLVGGTGDAPKSPSNAPNSGSESPPATLSRVGTWEASKPTNTGGVMDFAGAYNEIANAYDEEYDDAKSLAENNILKRVLRIGGYTEGRVLDVGCGTGLLLDLFGICSKRYVGIDPSIGMLEVAREKYPDHVFGHCAAENMHVIDLEEESFDNAISLFGPINYSKTPDDVIFETSRLLKPGGQFLHMLYSKKRKGKTYILDGSDRYPTLYNYSEVADMFDTDEFTDVRIFGLTGVLENFRGASVSLETVATAFGWVEILTAGIIKPDLFQYLMVTGVKV